MTSTYKQIKSRRKPLMEFSNLKKMANEVRKGIIEGTYNAKSGHPGGSLSCTDILTYLHYV